jgi:hypothetical protein
VNYSKVFFAATLVVMVGICAWAQETPKADLSLDYSFVRFNPDKNLPTQSHDLNGGGGSVTFNATSALGLKAEFFGYSANTSTLTIPVGNPVLPRGGTFAVSGNLFTYLFGPQIKIRAHHFQPFGEVLFGGAYSNTYVNLFRQAQIVSVAPSRNAFAFTFGGGLDIPLSRRFALRPVEIDYLLTRFGNTLVTTNQNNFRYAGGITFFLGSH